MRIAFYSPAVEPDATAADGAARQAALMGAALDLAGHDLVPVSRLRTWDDGSVAGRTERLAALAGRIADRLIARWRTGPADQRPALWFTHRPAAEAPDWLGPPVTAALGIPYVIAEPAPALPSDIAPAAGEEALRQAVAGADAVVALTGASAARAEALGAVADRVTRIAPFLDLRPFVPVAKMRDQHRAALAARWSLPADRPWLLTVAPMRFGAKLESYRVLADCLSRLTMLDWTLVVVGDGPARPMVEAALGRLPRSRLRLCGALPWTELLPLYATSTLYVWPGLGEQHGLALLEAQASGLPVVACKGPVVSDVVHDGFTGRLALPGNPASFANGISFLLRQPAFLASFARQARETAYETHSIGPAAVALDEVVEQAAARRSGRDRAPSE